jgi:hypothetical protein
MELLDRGVRDLLSVGALVIVSSLWGKTALAADGAGAPGGEPRIGAQISFAPLPDAPQCPNEDDLRLQLQLRLGYDPFEPDAPMRIKLETVRRGGQVVVIVDAEGGKTVTYKHREFKVADTPRACWDGMLYAAGSISMFFLPMPEQPAAPPPVCPAVPPPAAAKRAEVAKAAPPGTFALHAAETRAVTPSSAARRTQLSFVSLSEISGTPLSAVGAGFGLLMRRSPGFSFGAEARAFLPAAATGTTGRSFTVTRAAGVVTSCWDWFRGFLYACPVVEAGVEHFDTPAAIGRSTYHFLLGLGGRIGGEFPLAQRWSVRAQAEALLRPIPSTIGINTEYVLGSTSPVAGVFGLGVLMML